MDIPAAENLHLTQRGMDILIPLEYNRNDKGSLFAGSIYSGAVMAGYRKAEQLCADHGLAGDLVAKEARIRYFKAILSDGLAVATASDNEPVLKPNGNYSLNVTVTVNNADSIACAALDAEYILMQRSRNQTEPM